MQRWQGMYVTSVSDSSGMIFIFFGLFGTCFWVVIESGIAENPSTVEEALRRDSGIQEVGVFQTF